MVLTIAERIEIFNLYTNHSARQTAEMFNQRHPHRPRPLSHVTVLDIKKKFDETGSLENRYRSGRPSLVNNPNRIQQVRVFVNANPRTNLRVISDNVNLSRNTVFRILHNNEFHAYKAQMHQKVLPGDDVTRLDFCNRFNGILIQEPWIIDYILWTDESLFRVHGTFNRNNNR
jgi:transposase